MSRSKAQTERIAVLEAQMAQVRTVQDTILAKQDQMLTELARYRGAFGLATIIFSAIATALIFFKDAILAKIGVRA